VKLRFVYDESRGIAKIRCYVTDPSVDYV